jgi:hypothetical protein
MKRKQILALGIPLGLSPIPVLTFESMGVNFNRFLILTNYRENNINPL